MRIISLSTIPPRFPMIGTTRVLRSAVLSKEGFDLALQLDQQRLAPAIHGLARGHLDPALADAVFADVGALLVIQPDADVVLEQRSDVVRAAWVVRQAVGYGRR